MYQYVSHAILHHAVAYDKRKKSYYDGFFFLCCEANTIDSTPPRARSTELHCIDVFETGMLVHSECGTFTCVVVAVSL